MKSIEEHNREALLRHANANEHIGSGIQCPHCGDEMKYTNPGVVLASYPPQKRVECFSCNYATTVLS